MSPVQQAKMAANLEDASLAQTETSSLVSNSLIAQNLMQVSNSESYATQSAVYDQPISLA